MENESNVDNIKHNLYEIQFNVSPKWLNVMENGVNVGSIKLNLYEIQFNVSPEWLNVMEMK